ncbi:hypothetical protein EDM56_07630 [Brevibacillus fluminis]|uniref:Uncharacterized protein n=1 Tax=Brevibacillus fluminis TaxID=511487 RepID=A0A3M8DSF1_9BACL|nr:hypothetical protein EDM56_07630 [Brevibacillus fluminis]
MPAVPTFVTFFPDERAAQHFVSQLALDTSISSITMLNESAGTQDPFDETESYANSLQQHGFSLEQCSNCESKIGEGNIALLIEGNDATDILLALQEYGVQSYHMV